MKLNQNYSRKHNQFSFKKIIAVFLSIILLNSVVPYNMLYAGTNGPNSPEASGFEPVDATDMVNLSTGDLAYVLPLLDVDGFPVNLSYHAGVTQDLDASWVGLGWYLNPGAINRTVTNTPDDWKDGVGINFTSYSETENYYGVTVDLGFPSGPSVGAGLNWGGGKGLSGSVSASMSIFKVGDMVAAGSASASASTNGSLSAGLSVATAGGGSVSAGGGASVSYNLYSKKGSVGIGVGISMPGGSYIGASYSTGGFGINAGQNYKTDKDYSTNSGLGMSSGSFSSGDNSVDQQSMAIAIPLHAIGIPLTLGFSHTKVKYSLRKGYKNRSWGALYSSDWSNIRENGQVSRYNNEFTDYQSRTKSMDVYATELPQSEEEFVADNSKKIENINFTFMGYDDYNVSAQGISGSMHPKLFQSAVIFGKGERTQNANGEDIHAFYHYGKYDRERIAQRDFGKNLDWSSTDYDDLYFYFDGQITSRDEVINSNPSSQRLSGGNKEINDFLDGGEFQSNFDQVRKRSRTPSYIQVFTNKQIANGYAAAKGLITPSNISNYLREDESHFDPDGIGAYMITSPDGKSYHFALPVYHYERIYRNLIKTGENSNGLASNVSEKRQYSKYATHWLLTSITGSDYVNNSSKPGTKGFDKSDYGYWVELEYGNWSDGFVWRSPYENNTYDYNTNLKGEIGDKDKGHYSFGRKQIYYLDKIRTRNKTAIFVKDIRKDAVGQSLKFAFNSTNDIVNPYTGTLISSGGNNYLNETSDDIQVRERGVSYKREYNLSLDKIILLNTEVADELQKNTGSGLGTKLPDMNVTQHSPNWESEDFIKEYQQNYSYKLHQENNVFDVNDIDQNFIEKNALKVVNLEYSYDLAKNSPSSPKELHAPDKNGKLTLEKVHFKGKGGADYMPPYKFDYHARDLRNISPSDFSGNSPEDFHLAKENSIDNWGFLKGTYFTRLEDSDDMSLELQNKAKAWSLKRISMPTGAAIDIEYEEDDYYIEAFSRRFWQENLKMFNYRNDDGTVKVFIQNQDGIEENLKVKDFRDYFTKGEKVFFDYWIARRYKMDLFTNNEWGGVDILPENNCFVKSVSKDQVVIQTQNAFSGLLKGDDYSRALYRWFCKRDGCGSNKFISSRRGDIPSADRRNDDHHIMYYKLLANRVPENQTGGGLRVAELTTHEGTNAYKVEYDYEFPLGHEMEGRSSGITSYSPVEGLKFVPYQSEVPSPGVMYEYVTMTEKSVYGDYDLKTRYRFNVLKPVYNIFNPNITMNAMETSGGEDDIFWVDVSDSYSLDGNNEKKLKAKTIDVYNNTALLGQIKSIETFNELGQLIYKTENEYINGEILTGERPNESGSYTDQEPNKGYVRESFNSLKSIFKTDENGKDPVPVSRLLSISSKTEYDNMLKRVTSVNSGYKSSVSYKDVDPWLGSFRKSISKLSDGTIVTSERIPAYEKYPQMQSMVLSEDNKNMLSQQAMSLSYLRGDLIESSGLPPNIPGDVPAGDRFPGKPDRVPEAPGRNPRRPGMEFQKLAVEEDLTQGEYTGRVIEANITTWRTNWDYNFKDYLSESLPEHDSWRKHKEYVWKEALAADGTYLTDVSQNDHFNWELGVADDGYQDNWINTSTIAKYSPQSSPVEVLDINNNAASVLIGKDGRNIIATSDAPLAEIFYSGAEETYDGQYFSGGVQGVNFISDDIAHTGNYSLKLNRPGDRIFEIQRSSATNAPLRNGVYKVSYWISNSNGHQDSKVFFNGTQVDATESVEAGCWVLKNHYVDYQGGDFNLHVSHPSQAGFYYDDFRVHPISSSLSSYVYDWDTNELTYILDSQNLASAFKYDVAGRLQVSYKEVPSAEGFKGGFKVINKNTYQYHRTDSNGSYEYPEDINQCLQGNINL